MSVVNDLVLALGGTLLDYTHPGGAAPWYIIYASVTAPGPARIEVKLNGATVDVVYVAAGTSHSWWSGASGAIVPGGVVQAGDRLLVTASAPCALRID